MATVAPSAAASDLLAQWQSQSASWMRSVRSFTPRLRLAHLLDEDGVVAGSEQLQLDVLASWVLLFLVLYGLFALVWRLLPRSTGLQTGKLPFVAASRCQNDRNNGDGEGEGSA